MIGILSILLNDVILVNHYYYTTFSCIINDMHQNEHYLKTAISAAKLAGPDFKKYFGKPRHIKLKGGDIHNQVTEVDVKLEQKITAHIKKSFPGAQFIGEELAPNNRENLGEVFWIIDPIDGTTNYIQGIPMCCVSVAAWDKNGPLAGVLYNPIQNQIYTASRGQGAFLNGKQIKVSSTKQLKKALGGVGWFAPKDGLKLFSNLIFSGRKLRVFATTAWQLGLVASGTFDFFCSSDLHIWDVAAGLLIVQEAGGKATLLNGKSYSVDCLNILASNGKLHSQILSKVKKLAS